MRISILPKTSLGKWSTGLIIAAFLMLVVFIIEEVLKSRGGVTYNGAVSGGNTHNTCCSFRYLIHGDWDHRYCKKQGAVHPCFYSDSLRSVLVLIIGVGQFLIQQ